MERINYFILRDNQKIKPTKLIHWHLRKLSPRLPGPQSFGPAAPDIILHACIHAQELWGLWPLEKVAQADTTETLWAWFWTVQGDLVSLAYLGLWCSAYHIEEIRPVTGIENPELLEELNLGVPLLQRSYRTDYISKTASYLRVEVSCSLLVVFSCYDGSNVHWSRECTWLWPKDPLKAFA